MSVLYKDIKANLTLSVSSIDEVDSVMITTFSGEDVNQIYVLDIDTAIKFKKALTHEIQKAKQALNSKSV